jgi:hypothetical protein
MEGPWVQQRHRGTDARAVTVLGEVSQLLNGYRSAKSARRPAAGRVGDGLDPDISETAGSTHGGQRQHL